MVNSRTGITSHTLDSLQRYLVSHTPKGKEAHTHTRTHMKKNTGTKENEWTQGKTQTGSISNGFCRQAGQDEFIASHSSAHKIWKWWPQGNMRRVSWSGTYSAKQMAHFASSWEANKLGSYFTNLRVLSWDSDAPVSAVFGLRRFKNRKRHGKQQQANGKSSMTATQGKNSETYPKTIKESCRS